MTESAGVDKNKNGINTLKIILFESNRERLVCNIGLTMLNVGQTPVSASVKVQSGVTLI